MTRVSEFALGDCFDSDATSDATSDAASDATSDAASDAISDREGGDAVLASGFTN